VHLRRPILSEIHSPEILLRPMSATVLSGKSRVQVYAKGLHERTQSCTQKDFSKDFKEAKVETNVDIQAR
jgi:hypothetical protein